VSGAWAPAEAKEKNMFGMAGRGDKLWTGRRGAQGGGRSAARRLRCTVALVGLLFISGYAAAVELSPTTVLREKCGACHMEGGKLQRLADMRKTPEGWDMAIARMQVWHKIKVSKAERRVLVKHLADRYGLAPEEAAPYRFLIERVPNSQDLAPSEELAQMCGRCHSFGRVALQRRDKAEWLQLIHTHLGQFPSIEYSALGRDRNWWDIAREKTAGELAALYPRQTVAWKNWQARKAQSAAGTWRVAGHRPGWGDYTGYLFVEPLGKDRYTTRYDLQYAAGNRVVGEGESVVYTGYEWRGDASIGNEATRSVFAIDGDQLSGRWFLRNADEVGASLRAVRVVPGSAPTVLAVSPTLLKAGSTQRLRISGVKLAAPPDLGPGVKTLDVLRRSSDEIELLVSVDAQAPAGVRQVLAPGGKAGQALAIYHQIDSVRVEPAFGIARLGGGTNAPVSAQFAAVAWLNGPDGQPGTADDVRLGALPASWRVDNYDERARAEDDVKFAGHIEPHGQFIPASAGPNPARHNQTNTGDLKVIASVLDGERKIDSEAHLMVTVQRWNTPPLR
jgi:quinohemoprotein amine dehydrogenase